MPSSAPWPSLTIVGPFPSSVQDCGIPRELRISILWRKSANIGPGQEGEIQKVRTLAVALFSPEASGFGCGSVKVNNKVREAVLHDSNTLPLGLSETDCNTEYAHLSREKRGAVKIHEVGIESPPKQPGLAR